MCLYSKPGENKKYKANKKNGGNIPAVLDERTKYIEYKCGNCIECRKQYAREWQIRLTEDIKDNTNGKFIALTFSDESIWKITDKINKDTIKLDGYALDNAIAKYAVRHWLERWRKKYKTSIRHFLITELGHEGTENIHMHGIAWTNETYQAIRDTWQYGWIYPRNEKEEKENYVTERSIGYMTKYITKQDEQHSQYKAIILTTPGIGAQYLQRIQRDKYKYKGKNTTLYYRTSTGHKIALPKYWRNKLFTETEKEQLWIESMNKNQKYINGIKVKANDPDTIQKLLEWYRKRNIELGYGTDQRNMVKLEYEHQERLKNQKARIQKAYAKQNKPTHSKG